MNTTSQRIARTVRGLALLALGLLLASQLGALAPLPAQAAGKICFAEVPDCIEGRFAEFWRQNGGLPVFGYPLTPLNGTNVDLTVDECGGPCPTQVQDFERFRFELHPENKRPYDVLLGRLGAEKAPANETLAIPVGSDPQVNKDYCEFFPETRIVLCDRFLKYWHSHGIEMDGKSGYSRDESLALFGFPIGQEVITSAAAGPNGKVWQWFERVKMEYHNENFGTPYEILLGRLNAE